MYGTLADWRAHAAARGNTAPTDADDTVATAALTRASDYIKYQYVSRLTSGYDETLDVVELAAYEAANIELATLGFFSKTYTPAEQTVLTQVGSISFTPVNQSTGKAGHSTPRSILIEAMFQPYVTPRDGEESLGGFIRSVG